MKIDPTVINRRFEEKSWQVPLAISLCATPFMIISIFTENFGLEVIAKSICLALALVLFTFNIYIRSIRKKMRRGRSL